MSKITTSSTAEYFAKNLQQVGFSSPVKAVLTTLKEAMDNSLDACEEAHILPEITVEIKRKDASSGRNNMELVEVSVEDNGPGLKTDDLTKVFGEYLASSKFGKGRCSRGQQGIGISAATTWAQLTNASGVKVISKTKNMPQACSAIIDVDIKKNKGLIKKKTLMKWSKPHGVRAIFTIDGRIQLNGDGGLIAYLEGTALVNPHLTLHYKLIDKPWRHIKRVTEEVPIIPPATLPHPHTMKLGEFISHAHLFDRVSLDAFLKKGFSKINQGTVNDFVKQGLPRGLLKKPLKSFTELEYKNIFRTIQKTEMANPTTRSVLTVGEEALSHSIQRIGDVDFFSVITRKPRICDHKPVVVEVAVARLLDKTAGGEESAARLMRFANRVPLQFDKSSCAITKAVESVNWKAYGLAQQRKSLPLGPYVFAVSVTSPFIKFKNASKETIDASEELVEEIRRTLMQTGQKLARHIRREQRADELEKKRQYVKQFVPILVKKLGDITKAPKKRQEKATKGIMKILGQDTQQTEEALKRAESKLQDLKQRTSFTKLPDIKEEVDSKDTLDKVPDTQTQVSKKQDEKSDKKPATKKPATKKSTKPATKKSTKPAAKKPATKKSTKKKSAQASQKKKSRKKSTKKRGR